MPRIQVVASSLFVLLAVSGCGLFSGGRPAMLKAEAAEDFPPGSSATDFEAWFTAKALKGGRDGDRLLRHAEERRQSTGCEPRSMAWEYPGYCMNQIIAEYCVDPYGKIVTLEIQDGGYC